MSSQSISISIFSLKLLPELEKLQGHRKETEKIIHLPSTSGFNSENTSTQNIKVQLNLLQSYHVTSLTKWQMKPKLHD